MNAVALDLMAADPAPSVYLGRPCQHAAGACPPHLWTVGRYAEPIVASLAEAVELLRRRRGAEEVVLFGYSGGGTLAWLVAERLPQVRAVVTLAANLDVAGWVDHHGFVPLVQSLDPAQRPPLPASVLQIHLHGAEDRKVPPQLVADVIARQPGAVRRVLGDQDHDCCWQSIWPEVLADVEARLGPSDPP